MSEDRGGGMKSAYELALERLASEGIEPPGAAGLTREVRAEIAELRRRADAKLAELEILHRDRRRRETDPAAAQAAEEEYARERRRIEERRDRRIEEMRRSGGAAE